MQHPFTKLANTLQAAVKVATDVGLIAVTSDLQKIRCSLLAHRIALKHR
jgi:hypothetical protein